MELANREGRILLTEDKDFGRLFFASFTREAGVILIRYPTSARAQLGINIVSLIEQVPDRLWGAFVVLQPGRVRIAARRG